MTDTIDQLVEGLSVHQSAVQMLETQSDHLFHNRPGVFETRTRSWSPIVTRKKDGKTIVVRLDGGKKRSVLGSLQDDGVHIDTGRDGVCFLEVRQAGIVPEVATHLYAQVYDLWKKNRKFVAHLASWAAKRDHKDLKVVMAAFMLSVPDSGQPVHDEDGAIEYWSDDHRAIGEAMFLHRDLGTDARMLLNIHKVLTVPGVAAINIEMQDKGTHRKPPLGRYPGLLKRWLSFREANPWVLKGLVDKANFGRTVRKLCRIAGYKPESVEFFKALNWKQTQAKDGRREIGIGESWETKGWDGLSEAEVCERIVADKIGYKRMTALASEVTPAMMLACLEAGGISGKEVIILQPTFEKLGILKVPEVQRALTGALKHATDMRAKNIAERVTDAETKKRLEEGAQEVVKKKVEEAVKDLHVSFLIDISGSLRAGLPISKKYLQVLIPAFPADRTFVATFTSVAYEVAFDDRTPAGVAKAMAGYSPHGGTSYTAATLRASREPVPNGCSRLLIFVGDQKDYATPQLAEALKQMPGVTVGMVDVDRKANIVEQACRMAGVPYKAMDPKIFEDIYALPRALSDFVAGAEVPSGPAIGGLHVVRESKLIREILETPLLERPAWAA